MNAGGESQWPSSPYDESLIESSKSARTQNDFPPMMSLSLITMPIKIYLPPSTVFVLPCSCSFPNLVVPSYRVSHCHQRSSLNR
jgi:hypothetical protein